MTEAPKIRPMTLEDAEAVAYVHVRSWQAAYDGQMPEEYLAELSIERRLRMWKTILSQVPPRVILRVADNSGRVVGFAGAGPAGDEDLDPRQTLELTTIYLLSEHWDRGIGRTLIETVLEKARELDYHKVSLWVLGENERARAFYERHGFTLDASEAGKKKVEIGPDVYIDEVRFFLDLDRT